MSQLPSPRAGNGRCALTSTDAAPRESIGLREAVALIVGIVIGAGIFKAPSMVAGMVGEPLTMFAAWALGGLMSIIGALCYAELATTYRSAGGDYRFLRLAYGGPLSFLFAWARFSVIATGSIALLSFVFGDYLGQVLPLGRLPPAWTSALYAAAAVLVLSWINVRGIRAGTSAQTWLTCAEVAGLLLVVGAALYLVAQHVPDPAGAVQQERPPVSVSSFGLAMVFVLLTYGGWNEAAYISAELKDVGRSMAKALVLSILLITALYLLVNWAYWKGLGMAGMAGSEAVAAALLHKAFGAAGEKIIALVVAISALTSINATMIVGARTSYAAGRDWPALSYLGRWDAARGTPANALRVQCVAALLLVAIGAWTGSGFRAMVEFTAPVFWFFFLLAGLSLFVLRRRDPHTPRPFRVPLFPLLPLLFCAMCAYMLWASLSYVYRQSLGGLNAAWIGVAVLAAGALLLLVVRAPSSAGCPAASSETPQHLSRRSP